jgi:hypothetical protein
MPCSLADKYQCDGGPFTKPQRITSQTTVIRLSSWEHRTPYPRPSYRKITFHLGPGTIWSVQVPRHINCAAKFCTGALQMSLRSPPYLTMKVRGLVNCDPSTVGSSGKRGQVAWLNKSHLSPRKKTPSQTSRIINSAVSTSGTYHLETLVTFHNFFVNYCPTVIWNLFGWDSNIRAQ